MSRSQPLYGKKCFIQKERLLIILYTISSKVDFPEPFLPTMQLTLIFFHGHKYYKRNWEYQIV